MKLFYSPGTCSLSPHIALIESGLKFDLEKLDFKTMSTSLGDYKKIAGKEMSKKEPSTVSDDELSKTVDQIKKMRAQNDAKKDGKEFNEKAELPELDDAFVKTLGNFDSVGAFTDELKVNILKEKERGLRDRRRVAVMEELITHTILELPEIIVEQELHRMRDEFANEVERMGMSLEAYMKAVAKSEEDMSKEWRPDAEKRAKVQLIVSKIAEIEQIKPDAEAVAREAGILKERYPDAAPERIQSYLEMLLTNEKVFEFLEAQAK